MNTRIDTITCDLCKSRVDVALHFYDTAIETEDVLFSVNEKCYKATTKAKALCPLCGSMNHRQFETTISKLDIIKLATS